MYIWDCKIAPAREAISPLPPVAARQPAPDRPAPAAPDRRDAAPLPPPPEGDALAAPSEEPRPETPAIAADAADQLGATAVNERLGFAVVLSFLARFVRP